MSDAKATRRHFLQSLGAAGLALAPWLPARAAELPLTPSCSDGEASTLKQMEGPYFKPRSPQRESLLDPGVQGTRIVVTGLVLSTRCQPVQRALLDFWQCDGTGDYDNSGYRLRGHQYTDAAGRYRLETVMPGLYPGRTRHIHVKVQAPERPVLTTQVYFPGELQNQEDFLFRPELLVAMSEGASGKTARFDFVLKLG